MRFLVGLCLCLCLCLCLYLTVAACGGRSALPTTPQQDGNCTAPSAWYEPGCDAPGPAWTEGCYTSCETNRSACDSGFTCKSVMVTPTGSSTSDVCAQGTHLCLPSS